MRLTGPWVPLLRRWTTHNRPTFTWLGIFFSNKLGSTGCRRGITICLRILCESPHLSIHATSTTYRLQRYFSTCLLGSCYALTISVWAHRKPGQSGLKGFGSSSHRLSLYLTMWNDVFFWHVKDMIKAIATVSIASECRNKHTGYAIIIRQ